MAKNIQGLTTGTFPTTTSTPTGSPFVLAEDVRGGGMIVVANDSDRALLNTQGLENRMIIWHVEDSEYQIYNAGDTDRGSDGTLTGGTWERLQLGADAGFGIDTDTDAQGNLIFQVDTDVIADTEWVKTEIADSHAGHADSEGFGIEITAKGDTDVIAVDTDVMATRAYVGDNTVAYTEWMNVYTGSDTNHYFTFNSTVIDMQDDSEFFLDTTPTFHPNLYRFRYATNNNINGAALQSDNIAQLRFKVLNSPDTDVLPVSAGYVVYNVLFVYGVNALYLSRVPVSTAVDTDILGILFNHNESSETPNFDSDTDLHIQIQYRSHESAIGKLFSTDHAGTVDEAPDTDQHFIGSDHKWRKLTNNPLSDGDSLVISKDDTEIKVAVDTDWLANHFNTTTTFGDLANIAANVDNPQEPPVLSGEFKRHLIYDQTINEWAAAREFIDIDYTTRVDSEIRIGYINAGETLEANVPFNLALTETNPDMSYDSDSDEFTLNSEVGMVSDIVFEGFNISINILNSAPTTTMVWAANTGPQIRYQWRRPSDTDWQQLNTISLSAIFLSNLEATGPRVYPVDSFTLADTEVPTGTMFRARYFNAAMSTALNYTDSDAAIDIYPAGTFSFRGSYGVEPTFDNVNADIRNQSEDSFLVYHTSPSQHIPSKWVSSRLIEDFTDTDVDGLKVSTNTAVPLTTGVPTAPGSGQKMAYQPIRFNVGLTSSPMFDYDPLYESYEYLGAKDTDVTITVSDITLSRTLLEAPNSSTLSLPTAIELQVSEDNGASWNDIAESTVTMIASEVRDTEDTDIVFTGFTHTRTSVYHGTRFRLAFRITRPSGTTDGTNIIGSFDSDMQMTATGSYHILTGGFASQNYVNSQISTVNTRIDSEVLELDTKIDSEVAVINNSLEGLHHLDLETTSGSRTPISIFEEQDYGVQLRVLDSEFVSTFHSFELTSGGSIELERDSSITDTEFPIPVNTAYEIKLAGNASITVTNTVAPTYDASIPGWSIIASQFTTHGSINTGDLYHRGGGLKSVHTLGTDINIADTEFVKDYVGEQPHGDALYLIDTDDSHSIISALTVKPGQESIEISLEDSEYVTNFSQFEALSSNGQVTLSAPDGDTDSEFPIPLNTSFTVVTAGSGRITFPNTTAPTYIPPGGGLPGIWEFDSDLYVDRHNIQNGVQYRFNSGLLSVHTIAPSYVMADTDFVKTYVNDHAADSHIGPDQAGYGLLQDTDVVQAGRLSIDTDKIVDTDYLEGQFAIQRVTKGSLGTEITAESGDDIALISQDDIHLQVNAGDAGVFIDQSQNIYAYRDTDAHQIWDAALSEIPAAVIDTDTIATRSYVDSHSSGVTSGIAISGSGDAPTNADDYGIAIGYNAVTRGGVNDSDGSDLDGYSIAIGGAPNSHKTRAAAARGSNSIAIGRFAHVDSEHHNGVAFGVGAETTTANEMRLGGGIHTVTVTPDKHIVADNQLATKEYVDSQTSGPIGLVLNSTSPDAIAVSDSDNVTADAVIPMNHFSPSIYQFEIPVSSNDTTYLMGFPGVTWSNLDASALEYFEVDTDSDIAGSESWSSRVSGTGKSEYLRYVGTDGGHLKDGFLAGDNVSDNQDQLGFRVTNSNNYNANLEMYGHIQLVHWEKKFWDNVPHLRRTKGTVLYQATMGNTGFSDSTSFHSDIHYSNLTKVHSNQVILNNGDVIGFRMNIHVINCDTDGLNLRAWNDTEVANTATMFGRKVFGKLFIDTDSNLSISHDDTDTVHVLYNFDDDRVLPDRLSGPDNQNTPGSTNWLRGDGRWEPIGVGGQDSPLIQLTPQGSDSDADINGHDAALAIGADATVDGNSSIAIGQNARALSTNNIAIGAHGNNSSGETIADENQSIAIGDDVNIQASNSIGLGSNLDVTAGSNTGNNIIIGHNLATAAGVADSIVLGKGAAGGTTVDSDNQLFINEVNKIRTPQFNHGGSDTDSEAGHHPFIAIDHAGNWTAEQPKWAAANIDGYGNNYLDWAKALAENATAIGFKSEARGPNSITIGNEAYTGDTENNHIKLGGPANRIAAHQDYVPAAPTEIATKDYVDQSVSHPNQLVLDKYNADEIGNYRDTDFEVRYSPSTWDSDNYFMFDNTAKNTTAYYPMLSGLNPSNVDTEIFDVVSGSLNTGILTTVWPTDTTTWEVLRYRGADGGQWRTAVQANSGNNGEFVIERLSGAETHTDTHFQLQLVRIAAKDWNGDPLTSAGHVLASSHFKGLTFGDTVGTQTRMTDWITSGNDSELLNSNDVIMMRLKVQYGGLGIVGNVRMYTQNYGNHTAWQGSNPLVINSIYVDSDGDINLYDENATPQIKTFYHKDSDYVDANRLATNTPNDTSFLRGDNEWVYINTSDAVRYMDTDANFFDVAQVNQASYGLDIITSGTSYVGQFDGFTRNTLDSTLDFFRYTPPSDTEFPVPLNTAFVVELAGNGHLEISNSVAPTYSADTDANVYTWSFPLTQATVTRHVNNDTAYHVPVGLHDVNTAVATAAVKLADTDFVKTHVSVSGLTDAVLSNNSNTLTITKGDGTTVSITDDNTVYPQFAADGINNATASGTGSIAIGDSAGTGSNDENSIAIGHNANTDTENQLVINTNDQPMSVKTPGFTGGAHQYISVDSDGNWNTAVITNSGDITEGFGIDVAADGHTLSVDTDVVADTDWVKDYAMPEMQVLSSPTQPIDLTAPIGSMALRRAEGQVTYNLYVKESGSSWIAFTGGVVLSNPNS